MFILSSQRIGKLYVSAKKLGEDKKLSSKDNSLMEPKEGPDRLSRSPGRKQEIGVGFRMEGPRVLRHKGCPTKLCQKGEA